jgi:sulfite exporter TauE/SafE
MLAFGLGTLPNLFVAAFLFSRVKRWWQTKWVRWIVAVIIAAFALWSLDKLWIHPKPMMHHTMPMPAMQQPMKQEPAPSKMPMPMEHRN